MGSENGGGEKGPCAGPGEERGVSLRSIGFGACLSITVNLLANTVLYVPHGSFMAYSHVPMASLILFLLSMLVCALLARRFGRRFAFSSTEWITIFCMGFISALGPTYGVSGYIVSLIVAPHYFASPENRWSEYLHPYLPEWLVPSNDTQAMTWFYEGLPSGVSVPWNVWAAPLLWWFILALAVAMACACVSILIHRQWSANERLVYPAMIPVVEMTTRVGTGRRGLPDFMKGKVFWAGFALTTFIFWWNMISWFYPTFPTFPTAGGVWIRLPRAYPPLWFFVSTVVICFSYFASLEVLLSLWLSDVLFILEAGALNRIGFHVSTPHWGAGRFMWQTSGAFIALVLWGIWVARHHLRDAIGKALHPDRSSMDDSRELLSYRGALIGLAVSCLYISAWLWQLGAEVKLIVLLVPSMLLVYTGLAKIVADSGFIYASLPASAGGFTASSLSIAMLGGAKALSAPSHVAIRLSSFTMTHHKGFAMVAMAHVNRLADFVRRDKRRLFLGLCLAFTIGVVLSTFYTVWLGYTVGGYNFQPNYIIIISGAREYQWTVSSIVSPKPIEAGDYWFFLGGATVMVLLNLMRYRFKWWPIHPIGFALSGSGLVRRTSSAFFVAWLIKLIMLRTGGAAFYRRSMPFFIGMLVGYVLAVAAGVAVDAVWFPYQGHRVHKFY